MQFSSEEHHEAYFTWTKCHFCCFANGL